MILLAIASCLLGAAIVRLLIPLIVRECARRRILDRPSDLHHAHSRPVPRLGGLALAGAFVGVELFIALVQPDDGVSIPARDAVILGSLAMFGLGLWDDLRGLGARKKLLGQILIAVGVCTSGIGIQQFQIPLTQHIIPLGHSGLLVTVFWLVAVTNLINLIDGADGLAAGICLMLMLLIAYVGHQGGSFELLAAGMSGALLAFLRFNFPPARIYLGDGGAYFLGFQIGLFSLIDSHKGAVFASLAAPMFVLALPILDTSLAIARRGLWGLPIFRPDRRHLHHHLQSIGFSRRRVVLSFYAVTLVFLVMGFVTVWSRGHWIPGLLGFGSLVLLACAGSLGFSREWFAVGRVVGNSFGMRKEIQYALSLTHWLELEGERCGSLDGLWTSFSFAAHKLGFTSAKLTSAGGQRAWAHPHGGRPTRSARYELHGGRSGILELEAPDSGPSGPGGEPAGQGASGGKKLCLGVSDSKAFEILSELLAEGWLKSAARCNGVCAQPENRAGK